MSKFLKIVAESYEHQNRNKREISVIKEMCHETIVMAKGDRNKTENIDGVEVHFRTTRPLGECKYIVNLNKLTSILTWASYARKVKPDCISGHDLIGLFIGWISTWFIPINKKPLLVYDSHEFELGRNTNRKRNKVTKWGISVIEKFLINKCTFSMMVNNSIATEVQKIYDLTSKPVVVRNIPSFWKIDENIYKQKRKQICKNLNIPEDTFLVMYHGGISKGRGIENLIQANNLVEDSVVIILGYGEQSYMDELKNLIRSKKTQKKVFFLDAVPIEILWQYVGAANVGAVTIENVSKSYYLSLPNKLFENIQSLTPVIGSSFPEIKKIVEGYGVGICCDPSDVNSIADSIRKLKDDKYLYNKLEMNLKKAKEELTWENEKKVLIEAYSHLFELIRKRNNTTT